MFIPQRYMTLSVNHEKIILDKKVFGIVEDSFDSLVFSTNYPGLIGFLEKYKNECGVLIENNKKCIELFQELIDDGEPVPGYVMMFDSHIFFLLSSRTLPNGIKRIGTEEPKEEYKSDDNIIKLPDIRKLLERV